MSGGVPVRRLSVYNAVLGLILLFNRSNYLGKLNIAVIHGPMFRVKARTHRPILAVDRCR